MRPFWQFLKTLVPGTTARAEQVNENLAEIEAALEAVGDEMNRSIRVVNVDFAPAETTLQITAAASQRAGRVIAFNALGTAVELIAKLLNPRGVWAPIEYSVGDVVQAGLASSLYVALTTHVGGVFSVDLSAGRWQLVLDNTAAYQAARAWRTVDASMSPFALTPGDDIFVDVTAGPVVLTLPSSPSITMQGINVVHLDGPIGSNNLTIARNGQRIMGLLEDMAVTTTNAAFELGYADIARGWRLVRGV